MTQHRQQHCHHTNARRGATGMIPLITILLLTQLYANVSSFTLSEGSVSNPHQNHHSRQNLLFHRSRSINISTIGQKYNILSSSVNNDNDFDAIVNSRYACTRFQRYNENKSTPSTSTKATASISNPSVVNLAYEALDLSRRAPTGFNTQPYKLIMVDTKSKKEDVAQYCLGRNADRVRDSDCTAIFLADRECLREYKRFDNFLDKSSSSKNNKKNKGKSTKSLSKWAKRKMQIFVLLFSSGWPLPRIISNPISFTIRSVLSTISAITRRRILLPSLSSSETWSSKNTMLVAMTYMLACSSRGLATSPMEGFNIGGLRKVLNIPRRYTIPLIVSTGSPYQREVEEEGFDDVGMEHGPKTSPDRGFTLRYPKEDMIFSNGFGVGMKE